MNSMKTATEQTQHHMTCGNDVPQHCRAAVFERPDQPLALREIAVPTKLEPDTVLCKIRMSTICGSDLHTIFGRRIEPAPSMLGHEIVGEIVAYQTDNLCDYNGAPLKEGDRITWSVTASSHRCRYCRLGIPQKCTSVRKYGHLALDVPPHITGGYAEYICLMPGTALFKVADNLPDEVVAPANCTLATALNAVTTIRLSPDDTVLIQGAGLLGLYLCALAKNQGCPAIVVTDVDPARLDIARQFGADYCFDAREHSLDELAQCIKAYCPDDRLTVAFEACGAEVASIAVNALDIGGRYLPAGLVTPNSILNIDANDVVRKCLTIAGIHNYDANHLRAGLEFLEAHHSDYPFDAIVGKVFPLTRVNEAIAEASSGRHIHVGIKP